MRIADKMQFEQVKGNLSKNRSQMSELQNQAATQKRVTKPSDDPLAASRVLADRLDLQSNSQFTKNLGYAKSFLDYTDQSLGDIAEIMMRAKELAISQANDGSANEVSRRVAATEIEQLRNGLVSVGNRKLGDRFIFGGFRTQSAPFNPEGEYSGDSGEMNIQVDKESFVPMNIPGNRAFLGVGISDSGMVTPAPPQAATIEEFEKQKSSQMLESHTSPVSAPAVSSRGPASVNGATVHLPQAKLAAATAKEPSSGVNLFRTLHDLEISLRTNDKEGVQNILNDLDSALSQVVLTRSQVGSRSSSIANWMQTMEKAKVDNAAAISRLEDADVFETVSDINKTESTLQATLQTSGKLIQQSLLDFLR